MAPTTAPSTMYLPGQRNNPAHQNNVFLVVVGPRAAAGPPFHLGLRMRRFFSFHNQRALASRAPARGAASAHYDGIS